MPAILMTKMSVPRHGTAANDEPNLENIIRGPQNGYCFNVKDVCTSARRQCVLLNNVKKNVLYYLFYLTFVFNKDRKQKFNQLPLLVLKL